LGGRNIFSMNKSFFDPTRGRDGQGPAKATAPEAPGADKSEKKTRVKRTSFWRLDEKSQEQAQAIVSSWELGRFSVVPIMTPPEKAPGVSFASCAKSMAFLEPGAELTLHTPPERVRVSKLVC